MTHDYSLPDLIRLLAEDGDEVRALAESCRQRLEDAMLRRSIAGLMQTKDQWKMDAAWKAHELGGWHKAGRLAACQN
jgi:hypothetical protein